MKPAPAIKAPPTISFLGPSQSISQPTMGPSKPPSRRDKEKAPAVAARLQPNSVLMGLKKTLKP